MECCLICYEKTNLITSHCGHEFCRVCVSQLCKYQHKLCPGCRTKFSFCKLRKCNFCQEYKYIIVISEQRLKPLGYHGTRVLMYDIFRTIIYTIFLFLMCIGTFILYIGVHLFILPSRTIYL